MVEERPPLWVLFTGGPDAEIWTRVAVALWLPALIAASYLASRPGGSGPLLVYRHGPTTFAFAALGLIGVGVFQGFRQRPFLGRRRLIGFSSLAFLLAAASYPLPYPSSHMGRTSRVRLVLPFAGEQVVRWGGETGRENGFCFQPDRCFGYDFARWEALSAAGASDPAGIPGYGDVVRAPAAGRVAAAHDGERDHAAGERWDGGDPYGNWISLEIAPGEFAVLANLQLGSIAVSVGAEVAAGQELARVGASDHALFPHLPLHVQDAPIPRAGESVPFRFRDYVSAGRAVEQGSPLRGERVSPRP